MTRPARLVLLATVALTLGLLVAATATGRAALGPMAVWVVHHDTTADGSEVRLRPGWGLVVLWVLAASTVVLVSRRHDV